MIQLNNLTELSLDLKNNLIDGVGLAEILLNLEEINSNCEILVDIRENNVIGADYSSGYGYE